MPRYVTTAVPGTECLGDSRTRINNNFENLDTLLNTLSTNTLTLSTTNTVQFVEPFNAATRRIAAFVRPTSINDTHLASDSVTTAKLSAQAVTTDKIALSAVTQNRLAQNVTSTGPTFRAFATPPTITSVLQNTPTKVTLDTIQYDTNNNFTSSRFTPTVAGYYQINFHTRMEAKQDAWALLYKNTSSFSSGSVPSALNYRSTGSDLVYMNGTTDYLELWIVHQSAGSQNVTEAIMSGFLARTA